MWKKILSIVSIFVLVITMASCGSSGAGGDSPYAVSVKKGPLHTKLTIPKDFLSTADVEPEGSANNPLEIIDVAKEVGIDEEDVVTEGDGSLTVKMKNSVYNEFLTQLKIFMDDYSSSFIADNKDTCSFRDFSHDIKFTEFSIMVNQEKYDESDILSTMPFYFLGTLYQLFMETPLDEIQTTVSILDRETQNLLHTDSLTFEEYTEILTGTQELSTEEQEVVTATSEEEVAADEKDSSETSSETTATTAATTQATTTATTAATTQATTAAATQATTAATTQATTAATTAATTQATTAATTQATTAATTATTAATTAQSNRDLPSGSYKDMGPGTLRIANPSGNSQGSTSATITGSSVRLITEDFDVIHTSYIYIDGMLAAKTRLSSQQDLQLVGDYLSAGSHKIEVVQYANDDSSNDMITYKTVSYQIASR